MLGTFVGLVLTLGGTANALGASADLSAMRAALTAPVKGLGLAFGSSVAGVAASAMLGLMVALARRERAAVLQGLEQALAGPLRPFSAAYQRPRSEQAQVQTQTQAQMALVSELQGFARQLSEQQTQFHQGFRSDWLAEQARFHAQTTERFEQLAGAVQRSLQQALQEGSERATATLEPLVRDTLQGLSREAQNLQRQLVDATGTQLQAVAQHFEAGAGQMSQHWQQALQTQTLATQTQAEAQAQAWARHLTEAATLLQQSGEQTRTGLAQALDQSRQLMGEAASQSQALMQEAAQHSRAALVQALEQAREGLSQSSTQATALMREAAAQLGTSLQAGGTQGQALLEHSARAAATLLQDSSQHVASQLAAQQAQAQATLQETLAATQQALQGLQAQALADQQALRSTLADQATDLLQQLAQAQAAQHEATARAEAQRFAALQGEWATTSSRQLAEQQRLADALAHTARELVSQAEAQSRQTLAEVQTLLQAAAETPRAAAEMAAALRQQLSHSLAQDNALLAERNEQAQRLQALLNGAEQAAAHQGQAIQALQTQAAEQLNQAGTQFGQQVQELATRLSEQLQTSGAQLSEAALHLAASSAEMGSLGEGFGAAVASFQHSNQGLQQQLAQIQTALAQSGVRSEEQLAYTVAQARELIDLCLLAQKQAVDALRLSQAEPANG